MRWFFAIAVISTALYAYQLDRVPAFLTLDEAHFSVHAHAIAETGRNLNGQWLPLLIGLSDPGGEPYAVPWGQTYYLPFGIYMIAAALQVLPLDEAAVRLPSALLGGAINVGLIFAVGIALFRNRLAALAAAIVLSLAPAHVIISRQALDSVCQLPFTLGFLWCLGRYLQARDPRVACAAGAILGLGIYAYVTSIVFMPFYLAVFWLIAWRAGVLDRRAWLVSTAGFAAALVPMIAWLLLHPDAFVSIREQYNRADPGSATLMQTFASHGMGAALRDFLKAYWTYFDPSFLFVQGGNTRTLSTGEVGVFLVPVALLAPVGLYHLRTTRAMLLLLLIGLLASPIPAAIKGTPYQIQRASGMLIFISLLAGAGFVALWMSRRAALRALAAALVVIMGWQFAVFYRDYLGNYRERSGHAYDPSAFRDAAVTLIDEEQHAPLPAVYLPAAHYDMGAKWRFYVTKHGAVSLLGRTHYFGSAAALDAGPSGAMAVVATGVPAPEGWTVVKVIRDLAGQPTLTVLRR